MVGNIVIQTKSDVGRSLQKLSIEKACQEYNSSVQMTLDQINHQLDDVLLKNCNGLDELAVKIAARTNFLEKNPTFLSCLVYDKRSVRHEALLEFDDIRITLKEHSKRIHEKLEEIEKYHTRLLDLVMQNGRDESERKTTRVETTASKNATKEDEPPNETKTSTDRGQTAAGEGETSAEENRAATRESKCSIGEIKMTKEEEEDFQDCLDKLQMKEDPELNPPKHVVSSPNSFNNTPTNTNSTKTNTNTNKNTTTKINTTTTTTTNNKVNISFRKKFELTTKNSYDKVTIKKSAYSEMNLSPTDSPLKFQIFPDILPDVSRRRPTEDLHGKLIQQLVASDSLEGFLKLMDRKPTKDKTRKKKDRGHKDTDLEEKYTGSLWFFAKDEKKKPQSKSASVNTKISPIPQKNSISSCSTGSTCCNLIVTSSQPCPITNQERARKIRNGLSRNKLKYYDLLDDLDHSDLKPIKSEYPRRDNVYPKELEEAKSYLHRMMQENEKVWKKLLQPIEDRENHKDKKEKKRKYAEKKKHGPLKKSGVKTLLEYLTSPEQKYLDHIPQSLIVMPVKIVYDNFPTKDKSESPRGAVLITDLTKAAEPRRIEGKHISPNSPKQHDPYQLPLFPIQRRKAMLEQLKGLKLRNDNIQKNIQKAIDVIETKMIDLLSSPTDSTSHAAFNAMEKEITSVLEMMKENEPAEKGDKEEKAEKEKTQQQETEEKKVQDEKKEQDEEKEKKDQPLEEKEKKDQPLEEKEKEKEKQQLEEKEEIPEPQKEEEKKDKIETPFMGEKDELGTSRMSEKYIQPEKDDSVHSSPAVLSPKLKREATIVVKRSGLLDFKIEADSEIFGKVEKLPDVKKRKDESNKEPKIVKEERKPPREALVKTRYPVKDEKRNKKRERSSDKIKVKPPKHNEDVKKAANIEEGERLLGQVDSVIKKIDSIYNRFYDESKTKYVPKLESNFTNISDFFDCLKPNTATPPVEIKYKCNEVIPEIYYNPTFCHQTNIWHVPRWEYIPPVSKMVQKKEVTPCYEYIQVPASGTTSKEERGSCEYIPAPVNPLAKEEMTPRYEYVRVQPSKEEFIAELCEGKYKEKAKEVAIRRLEKCPTKSKEGDGRHEYALKTFYTLFFSSIFVALNFDYTS